MGGCVASNEDNPEFQKSQKIDNEIRKARKTEPQVIKLLLLGTGESGKSTVFKQLKVIQDNGGFSKDDLLGYKHVIHSNCITQMRTLLQAVKRDGKFEKAETEELCSAILDLPQSGNVWSKDVGVSIQKLWSDKGVKDMFLKAGTTYQINDSANYFFNNIDRFIVDDYIPTVDDVLRVRVRSTGIEEASFSFDRMLFKVVDVGGQRSERRKWIHCFSSVTCIIFCASLSDYDLSLREERTVNRMEEALDLFDEVVNSSWFTASAMILFLNKTDILEDKIKRVALKQCFPNYEGGADYDKACTFIEARFKERVYNGTQVYSHFTCAIDTQNIEFVINDVRKKVLENITNDFVL